MEAVYTRVELTSDVMTVGWGYEFLILQVNIGVSTTYTGMARFNTATVSAHLLDVFLHVAPIPPWISGD